ncbi:MAG: dienelactone hydrolase family protein [Dehalococcoidia bacterium]|nr:dienelactone hydrolase family protein [Dehalococcoidia bacterium]
MTTRPKPYEAMLAETVRFASQSGDIIDGYLARPLGAGPYPGVLVIHEAFGLLEHTKSLVRKFAARGYIALAPDLFSRGGEPDPSDLPDVIRKITGLPDSQAIADFEGAITALRSVATSNGKIGCIGHCSGGRHTLLFACNTNNLCAAIDCYGGRVVTEETTAAQPKPVIDMIADLSCPLLGLFGESDSNPTPAQVARLESELRKHNKTFDIKSYPGDTGHGFFAEYRPSYRQESAVDGWQRIFDCFGKYLS